MNLMQSEFIKHIIQKVCGFQLNIWHYRMQSKRGGQNSMQESSAKPHVCPRWFIRAFDNPIRRLLQNPEKILRGIVQPGDLCLDLGCGIGYFTIPMAKLVGEAGAVTAVDLQEEMLTGVRQRAEKAGVLSRIRLCVPGPAGLQFEDEFDFALALWMLHEVPDQGAFLQQVHCALKAKGRLMLVEPKLHVKQSAFDRAVDLAAKAGFSGIRSLDVPLSRAFLAIKT
jgi:2-polyprenyl-3-methyl-5-hydroxy-6-metoxy-1,4-benzoquinol methylase